ncbi:MAG: transposase, partial [Bacteroidales bacterium]|nr:transposase [Bacteroidales bacterium]
MDEHYLKHPTQGVLRMQDLLLSLGIVANHKRVRRLLRLMGLMAIYPKRNLSKLGLIKYIRPYLLKGLKIERPNQAWGIDISALGSDKLKKGISHAVSKLAVEILPRYAREAWRKGAVKFLTVLRKRSNKQNSLKCTEDRPFPVGRTTAESMMRQRNIRWKLLYLMDNLHEKNGLG